jgi:hypothetical protein
MNTTKTLALGALAALSIGIGSAMAQSEGALTTSDLIRATTGSVWNEQEATPVQAGSSDANMIRHESSHAVPFNGDYGDLANPG